MKFQTITFFFAASLFFFLSMFSICYWYFTYPIGLIFLSMFFSDYLKNMVLKIRIIFIFAVGIILIGKVVLLNKQNDIPRALIKNIEMNSHYELMANWMNKNIPPGKTIYHTAWSDSPYFICLNPKNYYLTMLDPVYMYYYNKNIYNLYNNLSGGLCKTPCRTLKKNFKTKYGYTGKNYGLYKQIKESPNHFKILFEDNTGAIFMLK